jgi:hypothetical protein
MIAAANLADLPSAAPEPPAAINTPDFPALLDASPRRLWSPNSGARPWNRESFMVACAGTSAIEAVERPQDVDGPGGRESWLFSPEANGAGLGWTVGSGLGADLGRSQPVIQDDVEELVNTVTHGLGLVLSLAALYALAVITLISGVWLVVFRQIVAAVPTVEFLWVVAGVAFYIGGFGFYSRAERRFFHSVWHVFVLAGSICHFRAVVGCLATMAS